jgi:serine/threonine protein kinase
MKTSSDENLLFSMWALQIGFIDSSQLVEAAGSWMFSREKPIGQIFVEKRFLTESMRSTLDEIVRKHVVRSGSIDKSLESLSEASSIVLVTKDLDSAESHAKPLPEEWEARIRELTETKSISTIKSDSQRFKVRKVIGHGGLGLVSEAYDCELDRTVAIKEIRSEHAMNPEYRARFITEAKITGLLDHPGIVPVHAIGEFDDGRPYYAMRLIRGHNMSNVIRELSNENLSGEAFLQRIRPLLRHLIDACNTLEYAFVQHGLLHRDVKPANIMIDKYGETVVVDWGLVKSTESTSQDVSQSQMIPSHVFDSGSQPTAEGQFRGTLNYMSPEQAKGLHDMVDHRSDIYGLGATLYTILVGRSPYPGLHWDGVTEYVDSVRENRFAPPRTLRKEIPAALESICLKAMATRREDRYQKASELAEDIDRWIAGDPVVAHPEGVFKQMERWGRKHLTALVSGIVLLTGLTLGLAWMNQRVRSERDQAQASEERAIQSRKLASSAIEKVVEQIGDNSLAQIPGMDEKRYEMLENVVAEITGLIEENPEDHAVKGDLIRTKLRLANIDRGKRNYAEARDHLHSILDWVGTVPSTYRMADPELRDEWDSYECDARHYLSDMIHKLYGPKAALVVNRKNTALAEAYMRRNRGVLQPAVAYARNRIQYAEIQWELSDWADSRGELAKAMQSLDGFISVPRNSSDREVADDPTQFETANALMIYTSALLLDGRCLMSQGDLVGAMKRYEDMVQASKRIRSFDVGLATGTNFLGRAYHEIHLVHLKQSDWDRAASAFEQAMEILDQQEDQPRTRFIERLYFLTQCDRARYLAKPLPELARQALQQAEQVFASINANESLEAEWELKLYMTAAQGAVARAAENTEAQRRAESEHEEARRKIAETKPMSPLLRELDLSATAEKQ